MRRRIYNATTAAAAGTTAAGESKAEETTAEAADYKIGIMTTTVSQSEESYRAAEKLEKEHPGKIVLATFPDKLRQSRRPRFHSIESCI